MVKFSTKGKELQEVQKGAKKEYFGKLKVKNIPALNLTLLPHK